MENEIITLADGNGVKITLNKDLLILSLDNRRPHTFNQGTHTLQRFIVPWDAFEEIYRYCKRLFEDDKDFEEDEQIRTCSNTHLLKQVESLRIDNQELRSVVMALAENLSKRIDHVMTYTSSLCDDQIGLANRLDSLVDSRIEKVHAKILQNNELPEESISEDSHAEDALGYLKLLVSVENDYKKIKERLTWIISEASQRLAKMNCEESSRNDGQTK